MDAWQFSPFLMAYMAASSISLFLTFISWNLRPINGSKILAAVFFAISIWITAYTLDLMSTHAELKLITIRFEYLGLITAVYLWFIFIIHYTDYEFFNKWWVYVIMGIIPAFTLIEILFLNQHQLFYHKLALTTIKNLVMFDHVYAIGFFIWAGYAYFSLLTSLLLVSFKAISMPRLYRKQILPIAISSTFLIIPNILHITNKNPIYPFDPTGLTFLLVGIVVLYSLNAQSFLEVAPIAHDVVFQHAKMGIIILNQNEQVIDVNPAATKILEQSQKNCLTKPVADILPEYYDLKAALKLKADPVIEINLGKKNITYEIKIASLRKKSGKKYGSIVMLWDISELKSAVYEIDAYAHTVAHDLKEPIGHMVSYANLLQNIPPDDAEHDVMLERIVQGGLKMTEIIDELLKLAKIRSIGPESKSSLDLNQLIPGILNRILPDNQINTIVVKPKTWPIINGNAIWIEEIWVNLISNAYKYGGHPPRIEIGWSDEHPCYQFFVKDNGLGISKEEIDKLFTEYSRLNKHLNKISGHGLGLSIVHRIIKKMGGRIWVESKIGAGSTFYFSIPK